MQHASVIEHKTHTSYSQLNEAELPSTNNMSKSHFNQFLERCIDSVKQDQRDLDQERESVELLLTQTNAPDDAARAVGHTEAQLTFNSPQQEEADNRDE